MLNQYFMLPHDTHNEFVLLLPPQQAICCSPRRAVIKRFSKATNWASKNSKILVSSTENRRRVRLNIHDIPRASRRERKKQHKGACEWARKKPQKLCVHELS